MDNGDRDCDGDGVADPNIVSGDGKAQKVVNLGQVVSDVVTSVRGITVY